MIAVDARSSRRTNRSFVAVIRVVLVILSMGVLSAAHAQQKEAPQKWALLIGIDEYEDRNHINNLGGAARDARALKNTLIEAAGFDQEHIQLLVSDGDIRPTRTNILNGLSRLVNNAHPGDLVFVLYAGHGIDVDGKPYLLPSDASALDDSTVTDTALEKSKFDERLKNVKASAVVLAFDMCRSDPRKSGKDASGRDIASKDNKLSKSLGRGLDFVPSAASSSVSATPTVTATFFSCSVGERSYEWTDQGRGYFSWYLEQGLRGKAADAKGQVTIGSLTHYLQGQVSGAVTRNEGMGIHQTPFPDLRGPDVGAFVLTSSATQKTIPTATVPEHIAVATLIIATVETTKGPIKILLYPDEAPKTVENFVSLARKRFYNGLSFHRVVPHFVIQGGDPKGDGSGGPGYTIPDERNTKHTHTVGAVAMAKSSEPDSAGSQFYIVLTKPADFLNGKYTVFGQVIEGQDVAEKIQAGDKINRIIISSP